MPSSPPEALSFLTLNRTPLQLDCTTAIIARPTHTYGRVNRYIGLPATPCPSTQTQNRPILARHHNPFRSIGHSERLCLRPGLTGCAKNRAWVARLLRLPHDASTDRSTTHVVSTIDAHCHQVASEHVAPHTPEIRVPPLGQRLPYAGQSASQYCCHSGVGESARTRTSFAVH